MYEIFCGLFLTNYLVTEEEIKKFHKSFKKLDEDKSGDLDPSEIFSVPGFLFIRILYNFNRIGVKSLS